MEDTNQIDENTIETALIKCARALAFSFGGSECPSNDEPEQQALWDAMHTAYDALGVSDTRNYRPASQNGEKVGPAFPCLPDRMHVPNAAGICIFCKREIGVYSIWPDPDAADSGDIGANLYSEAIRQYHFNAVFHAEVYMAVDLLDQEFKSNLSETEREVATLSAAIVLTMHKNRTQKEKSNAQ